MTKFQELVYEDARFEVFREMMVFWVMMMQTLESCHITTRCHNPQDFYADSQSYISNETLLMRSLHKAYEIRTDNGKTVHVRLRVSFPKLPNRFKYRSSGL